MSAKLIFAGAVMIMLSPLLAKILITDLPKMALALVFAWLIGPPALFLALDRHQALLGLLCLVVSSTIYFAIVAWFVRRRRLNLLRSGGPTRGEFRAWCRRGLAAQGWSLDRKDAAADFFISKGRLGRHVICKESLATLDRFAVRAASDLARRATMPVVFVVFGKAPISMAQALSSERVFVVGHDELEKLGLPDLRDLHRIAPSVEGMWLGK